MKTWLGIVYSISVHRSPKLFTLELWSEVEQNIFTEGDSGGWGGGVTQREDVMYQFNKKQPVLGQCNSSLRGSMYRSSGLELIADEPHLVERLL